MEQTEDIISPLITTRKVETDALTFAGGYAVGVQQIGRGRLDDEVQIYGLKSASMSRAP